MTSGKVVTVVVSIVLGVVLSPVIGLLGVEMWSLIGGTGAGSIIVFLLLAIGTFVLTIWKSGGVIRRVRRAIRRMLGEPAYSVVELGLGGTVVSGGLILMVILLLGHTRPSGLNISDVPLMSAVGLAIGAAFGLPTGREKARRRKIYSRSRVSRPEEG